MSEQDPLPLGAPDTYALRRRVLLTAGLAMVLYLLVSYALVWLDVSDAWLLVALALIYLLVVRPLMRPVREAVKLRRRLAYDAWLDDKRRREDTDPPA